MKPTWFLEQIKSPVVSSKFPLGGGSGRVACIRVRAPRAPSPTGGALAGAGAAVTSVRSKGLGRERLW